MPVLSEFEPLRVETIDSIRARIDAGVNAALDPTDPRWTDTTPGGFFYDHTQVAGFEAEMLWDFASVELPASLFITSSWGIYLDYWGELLSLPRKDEAVASGEVTLTLDAGATEDVVLGTGTQVAVESATDEDPLVFLTTETATIAPGASLTVPVAAEQAGSEYNVGADAITLMLGAADGVSVTNAAAIGGGADVEADSPYKERLLLEFSSSRGGGTEDDYKAEALARPGIGGVVVERIWDGPGTVRLILTDTAGSPLTAPKLAEEQAYWATAAPIDHVVTAATPTTVLVDAEVFVELEGGYTITGEDGKEDVSAAVADAVAAYIDALQSGDDVLTSRVSEAALSVPGVYNVTSVELNTIAADLAIGALEVARHDTITLTPSP